MKEESFKEEQVLHHLKHYLPSQQALKDFIHHNSLHAFQHMKFYDAIFHAASIFGFNVSLGLEEYRQLYINGRIREDILERVISKKKGFEQVRVWKDKLIAGHFDENRNPKTGRLRSYWKKILTFDMDNHVQPLLFRILCSYLDQGISIDRFPVGNKSFTESIRLIESNSYSSFFRTKKVRNKFITGDYSLSGLLKTIVGDERYYEQYLFDQQFSHPG